MEKLRFEFALLASEDPKTNVICLTSIETPDGRKYSVPNEYRDVGKHIEIKNNQVYGKIKNSLKKRHQTRKVWVTLTQELRKCYLDDDENVQFSEQYLEEIQIEANTTRINRNIEPHNLGKISEKFLLEKFTSKNSNPKQWINEFEKECDRFDITLDDQKIEILKHFLEKSCVDWYSSMLIKFTINSEWEKWRKNFCETYGNKGWTQIRYSFAFKYQIGSLVDYATKKERLLLEVNDSIDKGTLINLIALGLPNFVSDKINRESLNEIEDLYIEIGKLEHLVNQKKSFEIKSKRYEDKEIEKRKPCKVCETLNKGPRYHPEHFCWFKAREYQEKKDNNIRYTNNSEIEVELNTTDPKN